MFCDLIYSIEKNYISKVRMQQKKTLEKLSLEFSINAHFVSTSAMESHFAGTMTERLFLNAIVFHTDE